MKLTDIQKWPKDEPDDPDPAPLTTADAARVLLAKWNSWWCKASHD